MDPSSRRRRIGVGGAVVAAAGSVWETRMQSDDEVSNNAIVKAIHLHAADEDNDSNKNMSVKEASSLGVNGKRRTWKSDVKSTSLEISRADSLKLTRPRSFGTTPPVTPRRSVGSFGTTPPVTPRRSISIDSNDKSLTVSVAAKKVRSDPVEGNDKTPGRVKKNRSELCTAIVKSGEFDSVALRKANSLPPRNSDKSDQKTEHVDVPSVSELPGDDKEEAVTEKLQIPEEVKEFGVCKEIVVSGNSKEDEQIDSGDHEEDEDEEEEEEEKEVEKKSVDVKEMNVATENSNNRVGDVGIKKYSQFHNRTAPSPSSVRKIPPPVIKKATSVYSVPPSTDKFAEEAENFTHQQSKLQSLVDLVMWREASRSAFVFGFGTFVIISSSYANDLNFSFISVVAYMGLIYLGVMFVFKSVIHRGIIEEEERHKVVGVREEDVKRMLRLIMPYLNESLLQLRALFSGDPSTTLKMGMVLFVLARCGSSITLWNLAKFGFFGAFTVPKIFISYSTHFSAYGRFWLRRFRDAWESCSHKKAVALALFTLVWNLSSVVARMSVASDSPVHSSSSDDLAAFLETELESDSDSSAESFPTEEADDDAEVANHRLKRQKLDHLESVDEEEIQVATFSEEISEASSSKEPCEHPGSFGNICIVCGQMVEETTGVSLRYINKGIRLHEDEISRLRDSDMKFLQRQRKLCLVLDLDHTLLNSTVLKDLKPEEEYLKSYTNSLQDVSGGNLFMLEFMHMMTKLRPFVHSFLKEASEMFVMYIYTMGDRPYAQQMAKLLDPKGEYFGDRIISRDDGTVRHQKSLDVVLGEERSVLILDDTENAWPSHKDNLIVIERYHFFASSCRQFDHRFQSLSQLKSDESEPDGALATVLKVLKQTHTLFFEDGGEDTSSRDVRSLLKQVRKDILKGCKVVFSRVFPTKSQPENHPLWRIAEGLGATCATEVDASVTHVVAMDVGTEKVRWAIREKKFVVHRGWIEAANYLWKKQPEENFGLEQLKKQVTDEGE
ncbi:unnamed protein product [Thlaspi arvense]|uniref:Reticulon-like protein n=1 Tax=Thlaspi arvense TaxID=13288 RepID=A0AAU9SRK3_THLAR|nr:unnamed protein product [Thlaspi arvense]